MGFVINASQVPKGFWDLLQTWHPPFDRKLHYGRLDKDSLYRAKQTSQLIDQLWREFRNPCLERHLLLLLLFPFILEQLEGGLPGSALIEYLRQLKEHYPGSQFLILPGDDFLVDFIPDVQLKASDFDRENRKKTLRKKFKPLLTNFLIKNPHLLPFFIRNKYFEPVLDVYAIRRSLGGLSEPSSEQMLALGFLAQEEDLDGAAQAFVVSASTDPVAYFFMAKVLSDETVAQDLTSIWLEYEGGVELPGGESRDALLTKFTRKMKHHSLVWDPHEQEILDTVTSFLRGEPVADINRTCYALAWVIRADSLDFTLTLFSIAGKKLVGDSSFFWGRLFLYHEHAQANLYQVWRKLVLMFNDEVFEAPHLLNLLYGKYGVALLTMLIEKHPDDIGYITTLNVAIEHFSKSISNARIFVIALVNMRTSDYIDKYKLLDNVRQFCKLIKDPKDDELNALFNFAHAAEWVPCKERIVVAQYVLEKASLLDKSDVDLNRVKLFLVDQLLERGKWRAALNIIREIFSEKRMSTLLWRGSFAGRLSQCYKKFLTDLKKYYSHKLSAASSEIERAKVLKSLKQDIQFCYVGGCFDKDIFSPILQVAIEVLADIPEKSRQDLEFIYFAAVLTSDMGYMQSQIALRDDFPEVVQSDTCLKVDLEVELLQTSLTKEQKERLICELLVEFRGLNVGGRVDCFDSRWFVRDKEISEKEKSLIKMARLLCYWLPREKDIELLKKVFSIPSNVELLRAVYDKRYEFNGAAIADMYYSVLTERWQLDGILPQTLTEDALKLSGVAAPLVREQSPGGASTGSSIGSGSWLFLDKSGQGQQGGEAAFDGEAAGDGGPALVNG